MKAIYSNPLTSVFFRARDPGESRYFATAPQETLQAVKVTFCVPRELAFRVRLKFPKNGVPISLDGSVNPLVFCVRIPCTPMPSQHSPDKEPLSLQIPRTLMGRLKKRAKQLGLTLPGYVISILTERTTDVVLTSKDYEAITNATRKAEQTGRRCATPFDGAS